ncbi:MAG: response regulator, partial [Spirochaetes bacterium]|nr:response regulator [Spirochaetota bacterium]
MEKVKQYTGKILVVDDEKVNVDFFQVMLSKLGFEVDTAYDGEEALKRIKVFNPDIILLDLIMPKLSGFELTNILKKDEKTKHIPIIILTAIDDIKEKVDMLELGIEDYITKPFNFIEILARIRSILRSKFLKDEILRKEQRLKSIRELEKQVG